MLDYSYDVLPGNRFRIRMKEEDGLMRRGGTKAEFDMPAGWRWPELEARLEEEARKLRG